MEALHLKKFSPVEIVTPILIVGVPISAAIDKKRQQKILVQQAISHSVLLLDYFKNPSKTISAVKTHKMLFELAFGYSRNSVSRYVILHLLSPS